MKPGLFTNFPSKEENEKTRSKSISSLKSLKLKQIKPNPNLNKVSNLSRIYAQDHTNLTKNMIEAFSPSNSKIYDLNSVGKMPSCKKSNSRHYISAKSELSMKKGIYKKRSPIASSRTKQKNADVPMICIEESMSTTINSNYVNGVFGGPQSNGKQRFCRFLSTSTLGKQSKDQSIISNETEGSEFRGKVLGLFEKFRNTHFEILDSFKHK